MDQPARKGIRAAALIAVSGFVLGGCTGSEQAPTPDREPTTASAPDELATTVRTGRVTGKLGREKSERAVAAVAAVVEAWHEAAYFGDYPREEFGWPGFRDTLVKQARKDRALTSNARIGTRIDGVQASVRNITVDLLAVGGDAVGATARFKLVLDTTGEVTRTVRLRGRLSLSPAKSGWQIFEYDVARGEKRRPTEGGAQ